MDKQQAIKLVKNTLQGSFDKQHFIHLVNNLLNHIESKTFIHRGNTVSHSFSDYIKSFERVGKYNSRDGKEIDILIVNLKKDSSLDRARTMQRNYIAKYLNGSRGQLKDAALVAFVAPNNQNWRFSLVKMEYTIDQHGKVKDKLTPARRYSFLVGANENSHTAQSQLLPLLLEDETNPTLHELEDAFGVEQVAKGFFTKYRDLFLRTKEALDDIVTNNAKVRADFAAKNINTADFAKKLLGQIVFLYFLQKKGWFGVAKGKEWGDGSKHFLRELFNNEHHKYTNFFNDILELLFYDALRLEHSGDYYPHFDCRIPFLNGGLFDPIGNYNWWNIDMLLPNELFSNNRTTKEGDVGDGILDIFDRYNFTVKEDEPLEKEVAVDPEMLGKVFENLLEVKDRKSTGTYYTPREIVHYMCQQSLINYLTTELADTVGRPDIEKLIKHGESAVEHDSFVTSEQRETGIYAELKLSDNVSKHATIIDDKLATIRICDPAVGSGAFVVGMMNEIVRARSALTAYIAEKDKRTPYHFKRQAIKYCLYGVDINHGAVEIAKLRLWLSLIVDEEQRDTIQPLPNLDYKIIQGNSLLSVEKNLFNDELLRKLERLKLLHYDETSTSKKQELCTHIDALISEITDGRTEFDFKVYFSEVFHEKQGFDVVIANPPYVRADSGAEHLAFRKKLEASKTYQTLYEKWDLMVPFIEKGLQVANNKGDLTYIVSNAICTSKYASKLLDWIQEYYYVHSIDYFDDIAVFDASVVPVVLRIGKEKGNRGTHKTIRQKSFENIVSTTKYSVANFKALGRNAFRKEFQVMQLDVLTVPLSDICYLSVGMVVNADEKIAKGEFSKEDLISKTKNKLNSRAYIEGKDIDAYVVEQVKYLEWDTKRVPHQLRRPTFPELYNRPKLMRGAITKGIYDDSDFLCNHSIIVFVRFIDFFGINNNSIQSSIKKFNQLPRMSLEKISKKFDLKYLLAIINSSFAINYLNNIRRAQILNYFYPNDFRKLPIVDIEREKQKPFIELVNKILTITKDDDYLDNATKQAKVREYEKQIDQLVYQLYNLTDKEIKIVEGS